MRNNDNKSRTSSGKPEFTVLKEHTLRVLSDRSDSKFDLKSLASGSNYKKSQVNVKQSPSKVEKIQSINKTY